LIMLCMIKQAFINSHIWNSDQARAGTEQCKNAIGARQMTALHPCDMHSDMSQTKIPSLKQDIELSSQM
jgi:hypothetical protein